MNYILILCILIILVVIIYYYKNYTTEYFDDNSRYLVSKNEVVIFCKNGWVRSGLGLNPVININNLTTKMEEFNQNWAYEKFVFEDINDINAITPITENNIFYIRTKSQNDFTPVYLIYRNTKWELTTDRNLLNNFGQYSLVKINKNNLNKNIEYGDKIYIKHVPTNRYLYFNKTNIGLIDFSKINKSSEFHILDSYGNAKVKDWAKESIVMLSSIFNQSTLPKNAIDGNRNTMVHTRVPDSNPICDVYLPKDIFITKIVIINRQDNYNFRLFPINIQIMRINKAGNEEFLLNIPYNTTDKSKFNQVVIEPIYKIGNKVRLHLPGNNRILHFSEIKIFGYGTENTIDIVNRIDKTIIPKSINLTNQIIEREDIPKFNNNMTILYKIKLNKLFNDNQHITLLQGTDQYSYSFKIFKNSLEFMGFIENDKNKKFYHYNQKLVVNKPVIVGTVVNRGVNPFNGWILNKQNNTNYLIQVGTNQYYTIHNLNTMNHWKNQSLQNNKYQLSNMIYLGQYNNNLYNPSISLFYGNKFIRRIQLPLSQPFNIPNYQRLIINPNRVAINGSIGPLFMSNKVFNEYEINNHIILKKWNNYNVNRKVLNNASLLNRNTIRPENLPMIDNKMSISFWFQSQIINKSNDGIRNIIQKPFVDHSLKEISHNSPTIAYNTNTNTLVLQFDTNKTKNIRYNISSVVIKPKQWYYINLLIHNNTSTNKCDIQLYVNNKLISKYTLPQLLLLSTLSNLYIGATPGWPGVNGLIRNVFISNILINNNQRHKMYSIHPDKQMFDYINNTFKKVGCKQNLVPVIDYNYTGNNWYKLIKDIRNDSKNTDLKNKMKSVKTIADKFLTNPQSVDNKQGIAAVNVCYGSNSKFVADKLYKVAKSCQDKLNVPKSVPLKAKQNISTLLKPKINQEKNKSLIVLPQIHYGMDTHYLYSRNKDITYPKLNNFSIQLWIMPNRTDKDSTKDYTNVFSINNIRINGSQKQIIKYDLFSLRYNLFNNQLSICSNNQSNNVYQCKNILQKLNQTVWNSVTIKVDKNKIHIQINNQQPEIITLNNTIIITDLYEFEFGKSSNRSQQKNIKLNVNGFNGFIKLLTISNYLITDNKNIPRISNFKRNIYNNENIDVEQLIYGAKYSDKFKNICNPNIIYGELCDIKSKMIPHIRKYWNLWKKQVIHKLGFNNKIKNINSPDLWKNTYVEYLYNRFDQPKFSKPVLSQSISHFADFSLNNTTNELDKLDIIPLKSKEHYYNLNSDNMNYGIGILSDDIEYNDQYDIYN